jgi:hypothetical protein
MPLALPLRAIFTHKSESLLIDALQSIPPPRENDSLTQCLKCLYFVIK